MFDYHLHTNFSPDSSAELETIVQTAIARGLSEICVTDHSDLDAPYGDSTRDEVTDYERFLPLFNAIKANYRADINLKLGIELGIQPHLLARSKALIAQYPFDFVLMSMHTAARKDLYSEAFFEQRSTEQAWQTYLSELIVCARDFDDFNVIGHLDLLKRYNRAAAAYDENKLEEYYRALFEILVAKNKGLEINTASYRNANIATFQPSVTLLRWFRDCGGQILTLGSDSHRPDSLAYKFGDALAQLDQLGFTAVYTFDQMKASAHSIKQLLASV